MNKNGVSPVIGIILLTAITVALVSLAAFFVFDVGQSTDAGIGTATVSVDYESESSIDIQLLKQGSSDKVIIRSALGTEYVLNSTGEGVTLLNQDSNQTPVVLGEKNGERSVIRSIPPKSFIADKVVGDGADEYSTVGAALEDAQPGDIVVLEQGTYYGNIDITTENITLVGESGTMIADNSSDSVVVDVRASGVRISNVKVVADSSRGGSAAEYGISASYSTSVVQTVVQDANTSDTNGDIERVFSSRFVNQTRLDGGDSGGIIPKTVNRQWVETYDSNTEDVGSGITVDSNKNVIVTGYTNKSGSFAYYTIKYNNLGEVVWNKTYNSSGDAKAYSVTVDENNNVIVTGGATVSGGDYDYHTIKYSSDGTELWNDTFDSGDTDLAFGVRTDSEGRVIVTGGAKLSSGDYDYYTIAYASDGSKVWSKKYQTSSGEYATDVAIDSQDNVIVTGQRGIGSSSDYYTIKYDRSGSQQWSESYDNGGSDEGKGVAIDSNDNVIVSGESVASGSGTWYTIKYNSTGTEQWNARLNFTDGRDRTQGVDVDKNGSVYLVGFAGPDIVTVKYNSSGRKQWTEVYDNGYEDARAIFVTPLGAVHVVGYTNPGGGNNYATVKYAG